MNSLHVIVNNMAVFFTVLTVGVILFYGAHKKWPLLVDPPDWLAFVSSHAALKKLFGSRPLLQFIYLLSALCIVVGVIGLGENAKAFVKMLGYWR